MDRVRVVKWEKPETGGIEDDMAIPTEIDPNEDFVDARGVVLQSGSSNDTDVYVTRNDSGDMIFRDKINGGVHTLSELLAGAGTSLLETRGIMTRAGGFVYSRPHTGGEIKLVVRNP